MFVVCIFFRSMHGMIRIFLYSRLCGSIPNFPQKPHKKPNGDNELPYTEANQKPI
jgi:hypothetical protein